MAALAAVVPATPGYQSEVAEPERQDRDMQADLVPQRQTHTVPVVAAARAVPVAMAAVHLAALVAQAYKLT